MNEILILLALLFTKHLIVDFPLQTSFQWKNKGTFGHPGGLLHAFLHSVGTFMCFIFILPEWAPFAALADGAIHYHVDLFKMKLNDHFKLSPTNSEKFWWLLGLDQWLHAMTYIGLVYVAVNYHA